MKSRDQLTFDVIIIGAGPSAAGLLYGLLTRILNNNGGDPKDLSIAILERGGEDNDTNIKSKKMRNDDDDSEPSMQKTKIHAEHKLPRFAHSHPSTFSLEHWFTAAHYTSKPVEYMVQQRGNSIATLSPISSNPAAAVSHDVPSPTILHTSIPQPHLNHRIIDVPTGTGWGGTTNIHAGLVMEPSYEGDFDNWPGRWKGGSVLKESTNDILSVLRENNALESGCFGGCDDANDTTTTSVGRGSRASNANSFVEICSGGKVISTQTMDWDRKFEEPITTSSAIIQNDNGDSSQGSMLKEDGIKSRRVNYFSALIQPLLRNHPELESHVTFLSGVQVERILVGSGFDRAHDITERTVKNEGKGCHNLEGKSGNGARAWAVECLLSENTGSSNNHDRMLIRSRQEIVVCAGAIGSPSLLLASGIGHEDDLRDAGNIVPWYNSLPSPCFVNVSSHFRKLPVGHNLRDHILLPRGFTTPRQSEGMMTCNSIHGWWLLGLPMQTDTLTNNEDGNAKVQLQLGDGIQTDAMIPHFAAAALQRRWSLPNRWEVPATWICFAFYSLRRILKTLYEWCPLIKMWSRHNMAFINVCLLNPLSVGKVTIVCQRDDENHHLQSETKTAPFADESISFARLSQCQAVIDPGYLSNPQDVEALWMGWNASMKIKQHFFGGCKDLPIATGFYLLSCLGSSFGWALSLLLGSSVLKTKQSNRKSRPPAWFCNYAAEFLNPYYHWCGTCAMGEEAGSEDVTQQSNDGRTGHDNARESSFVVDEYLCVRGIVGLRVCDASVFPDCVSAPTALTCAALGYAASAFIYG